jgi:hypothetical protein
MIKEVVISREAVEDLEEGRSFYERRQPGVGDYFWDSLLSDMESLAIFAGVHARQYGLFRMLSKEISLRNLLRKRSESRLYCGHTPHAKRSCVDQNKDSQPEVVHLVTNNLEKCLHRTRLLQNP